MKLVDFPASLPPWPRQKKRAILLIRGHKQETLGLEGDCKW